MENNLPFSIKEITDNRYLYGRNALFNQLIGLTNGNMTPNKEIIGMRRFGKTTLFKCIENFLRTDTKTKCYPLYIDFKSVESIKGTSNVYKYLISTLLVRLHEDNYFQGENIFVGVKILPNEDWTDLYEQLQT